MSEFRARLKVFSLSVGGYRGVEEVRNWVYCGAKGAEPYPSVLFKDTEGTEVALAALTAHYAIGSVGGCGQSGDC